MKKLALTTLAFCFFLLFIIWVRFYQDPIKETGTLRARDYEQDMARVTNDIAKLIRIKNDLKTVVDANSPTNVAFDAYADFFAGHKMFRNRYGLTNYIEGTTFNQLWLGFKDRITLDGHHSENLGNKPLNIVLVNATEIPDRFFKGTKVKSVIAPNVTKIGKEAFRNCTHLTYLFTSNVVEVGENAFCMPATYYSTIKRIWEVPGGVMTRIVRDDLPIPYTGTGFFSNRPIIDMKIVRGNPDKDSTIWARTYDISWHWEFPRWTWLWQSPDDEYPEAIVNLYDGQAQVNAAVKQKWSALTNKWDYNSYYQITTDNWYEYLRLPSCKVLREMCMSYGRITEIESCIDLTEIEPRAVEKYSSSFPLTCISRISSTNSVKIGYKAFYKCSIKDSSLTNWFTKVREVGAYAFSRSKGLTSLTFNNDAGGFIDSMAFANSDLKQLIFETNPDQIVNTAFIRFTNKEERESTGILATQSRHMTNVTFRACSIEDALQVSSGTTNKWYSFLPVGCEIVATNGTYTVQESDVQSWPWHPKE